MRILVFAYFALSKSDEFLTKNALVAVRNSLRVAAIEFHNIASVLDGAISGEIVSNPDRNEDRSEPGRVSPHLDHRVISDVLRRIPGATNKLKVSTDLFYPVSGGTDGDSFPAIIFEYVCSILRPIIRIGLFAFDWFILSALFSVRSNRHVEPVTPPGRSSSPIEVRKLLKSIAINSQVIPASLMSAAMIQGAFSSLQSSWHIFIYVLRLLALFPLIIYSYTAHSDAPKFGSYTLRS